LGHLAFASLQRGAAGAAHRLLDSVVIVAAETAPGAARTDSPQGAGAGGLQRLSTGIVLTPDGLVLAHGRF